MIQLFMKRALIPIAFLLLLGQARADEPSNKGILHVQISNQTGEYCVLQSQITNHGKLDSFPPQSLAISQSSSFDMEQAMLHGPSEELTYQCGLNSIDFRVSQAYAIVDGSTPVFEIINAKGLTAAASITGSSVLWNSKGIVSIVLK